MVNDPSEYRWSSYHQNALGISDFLINPHEKYYALANALEDCQKCYLELFKDSINQKELEELRKAVNKGWVYGDDKFKQAVTPQLASIAKGGDRKSNNYRAKINRF